MSSLSEDVAHVLGLDWSDPDERAEAKSHAEWIERIIAAREEALRESIAQEIRDAFPLPGEIEAICTAGHDCHAAARYTTGRMAARIAREVTS